MNQLCRVCGEPAAGFHFGAFTCEGCKSFFGRTYNNLSQINECKNGGACVINKQNRTSCKACRLKKCVVVGMSKSGSRYGRRSNWFKIHCLLQEQAAQASKNYEGGGNPAASMNGSPIQMTSLSPSQFTSLSPNRNEDDSKVESSAFSSPESITSEHSLDTHKRSLSEGITVSTGESLLRDAIPSHEFVANLGLYSLHPGLSLLQASQFYSRLYPPVLYPALAPPPFLQPPHTSPPLRGSPFSASSNSSVSPKFLTSQSRPSSSSSSSEESPKSHPSPALDPPSSPPSPSTSPKKRRAESPVEDILRPWHSASPSEQDAPIDLRVKRRRVSTNSLHPSMELEPPIPTTPKGPILSILPIPSLTTTPVNLSSKA